MTDPSDGSIPIYQHHKYADGTGHYLSVNSSESGYYPDRIAFRAFPTPKPGAQPVFEFWGQKNGRVYHFYQFGTSQTTFWHITGVKFYAYPSQVQGTIPVYGYSNPWGEDHFFHRIEPHGLLLGDKMELFLRLSTRLVWVFRYMHWHSNSSTTNLQ